MSGEIFGRDAELSVVQAFLDRPVEGLTALVLEGEAGIGKSTLWMAAVAAARERSFRVLASRPAETERTLAYVVLGDLFADAGPDVLAALPAPRRRAFESALLLREDPGHPIDPRALGVAIRTILPLLAPASPLVLAIDDDQWMDPSSLATLAFALRRSPLQPVLLLLSRRVDGTHAIRLEEAIDPAGVTRLRVGPLSLGATQSLLQERLHVSFPRPTLLRLHEVSGGNPFYAIELARARSVDPARATTLPLAVPASLERLVGSRLEALDRRTQQALLLVAAHGRLPVELVRALDVPPEDFDPAIAANLVQTASGIIGFTHPLLASGVYHGASGEDRRVAHRRLAAALDDPVHRGRHLALAADAPDADLAAALESAAIAAHGRGMAIAAAELGEHALRLTPTQAVQDRHRRAMTSARARMDAGEGGRARAAVDHLLANAPAGNRRAEALVLRAQLADPGSAVGWLLDALAEAGDAPALRAVIHAGLATTGSFVMGCEWAERHARTSLRLADELDDDALRATALSMLALLRFERGDRHALEIAERAYQMATGLADPQQVKVAGWSVGAVLTWTSSPERARTWIGLRLDEWRGRDEAVRGELAHDLALVELWSGNWSVAAEYAEQVLEIGVEYGIELPQDLAPVAFIALHRGQIDIAAALSRRALSLAGGQLLPYHFAVLAIGDLWSGRQTAGIADFERAEQTADGRGWGEPTLRWWRAEYVEALLQRGRIDEAARLVADWQSAAKRLGRERVVAHTVRCRGLIAAATGELLMAAELFEDAVHRHTAESDPFGRARALLALGVVRRRARQKSTARAALEEALAGFEVLGAAGWATTTRTELTRIGGRTRIEGLSPSELAVAALVAEGRTNREIASTLFLGERTVAGHLTHIYAKLGIRSRTELARRMSADATQSSDPSRNIATS